MGTLPITFLYSLSIVVFMLFKSSNPMKYQEPLSIEDLENVFNEDGCVEGVLSTSETAGPIFNYVSSHEDVSLTSQLIYNKPKIELEMENVTTYDTKSPLSMINELATFNKVAYQYTLIDEKGPAHKKRYVISLKLGEEEYEAEDVSIKKARREAARLALNSTLFEHPPQKEKKYPISKKTAVQKLYEWVHKHSGYKIVFFYYEQSILNDNSFSNYYHSEGKNVYKVCIKIGEKEFVSMGPNQLLAKENAAAKALEELQHLHGMCLFSQSERNILTKLINYNSDSFSPISLINEFSTKSKLKASFELVSEEGPAHIKQFTYKCSVGDFHTFGDDSSKKSAQNRAAEKMVQLLKSEALFKVDNCDIVFSTNKPSKAKRNKRLIKAVKTYYPEEEPSTDTSVPEEIDPISKLFQIQQKRGELEPVFRLIEKSGQTNKEFTIEVTVGDLFFVGSGRSKKLAKRNAAHGMLEKMGYAAVKEKSQFSIPDQKRKEFNINKSFKKIGPSVDVGLETDSKLKRDAVLSSDKAKKDYNYVNKNSKNNKKPTESNSKSQHKSSALQPMKELKTFAEQLGIRYQFSDFPSKKNTGFVSLLSLTTNPPKVCYGEGETIELSQDKAALTALENLYKNQLETIAKIMENPKQTKEEEVILKETLTKPFIKLEKE